VTAAVDEFPDLVPPKSDKDNVAGNHVVIACKGASILLAHMQAGSVAVGPGTVLATGTVVGRVGNSGNTSEPHLHVHAVRQGSGDVLEGEGMPLLFDGRFLVRNKTLRVQTSPSGSLTERVPRS
jgi:murein DD-endopeptidase MepM/ murein hydrolase activator NlpD